MASTTRTRSARFWTRTFAALFATLGVASMGSAAFAQDMKAEDASWRQNHPHGQQLEFKKGDKDGTFRLAAIGCGPNAAERLETRLDRLSDRLKLTAEQEKLFDAFRTASLTAQTDFADSCTALRPAHAADLGKAPLPGAEGPAGKPVAPPAADSAEATPPAGGPAAPANGKTLDPKAFADNQPGARPDRPGRPDRIDPLQRLEMRLALDEARIDAMKKVLPELKAFYGSLTPEQQKMFGRMGGLEIGRGTGREG